MKNCLLLLLSVILSSSHHLAEERNLLLQLELKLNGLRLCLLRFGVRLESLIQRTILGSSRYNELNYQWLIGNGTIYPLAYFLPQNTNQVASIVKCSRQLKIRLVARSGGHSFMKYSFGDSDSVIVDLQRLSQVEVNRDENTAIVGPGIRLGQLYYKLNEEAGLVLPAGECAEVGISGHALGGGVGVFSRMHGLTTDNILELEMVDANGNVLNVNKRNHADLLWAHQGGGGGNFGIVTKFKFRVHKMPPFGVLATLVYPIKSFVEFYSAYQTWLSSNPDGRFFSLTDISSSNVTLHLTELQYNFPSDGDRLKGVKEILLGFPEPMERRISALPTNEFLAALPINLTSGTNVRKYSDLPTATKFKKTSSSSVKSAFVDKVLSEKELREYSRLLQLFVKDSDHTLLIEQVGGAISSISPTATAFVHRKKTTLYVMQITGDARAEDMKAVRGFYESSKKVLNHTESYQNYLEPGMSDYLQRFYGLNLPRLIQIKIKYDPHNFFRYPISIPTTT